MTTSDAWATDEELFDAAIRFAEQVPGYESPVAYTVACVDSCSTAFAHLNAPGGTHLLPAAVLASVCDHRGATAAYRLDRDRFATAVDLLSPAEAATHHDHPNLWSWRALLADASADSLFVAVFVQRLTDEPVDDIDVAFRARLVELER